MTNRKSKPDYSAETSQPKTVYLVNWWHIQKLYVGLFDNETEATLHAAARNGVVVELIYDGKLTVGSVDDYWRRDDQGKPMPGEWRTSRVIPERQEKTKVSDLK